ncbi:YybH family protein [Streptomyces sp. NPDC008137]|uniref:YybH family protein n=1 Tax=Streptomyces sp. NPDC008137 TaxID=3364813 RepID=UPI0036EC2409
MSKIKLTLSIATSAIAFTAASIAGPTFIQTQVANASTAADESPATAVPADVRGTPKSAGTPAELLQLLGERIKAKDVDGIIALHESEAAVVNYDGSIIRGHKEIRAFYVDWFKSDPVLTVNPRQTVLAGGKRTGDKVRNRTAAIMGDYSLEQTAPDGSREKFTGNFCDTVQEQPNGTWLYVQDNPYPPHGSAAPAHH